jgi:hypothetical protein
MFVLWREVFFHNFGIRLLRSDEATGEGFEGFVGEARERCALGIDSDLDGGLDRLSVIVQT